MITRLGHFFADAFMSLSREHGTAYAPLRLIGFIELGIKT